MTYTSRPIYEQDPTRGERLHDELDAVHRSLNSGNDLATNHSTIVGDWSILLNTGEDGNLASASATRLGSDSYTFARTGEKKWSATTTRHSLFEEAHFYNLVDMAVRGADWV